MDNIVLILIKYFTKLGYLHAQEYDVNKALLSIKTAIEILIASDYTLDDVVFILDEEHGQYFTENYKNYIGVKNVNTE